jgi:hypothetical protein
MTAFLLLMILLCVCRPLRVAVGAAFWLCVLLLVIA